MVYFVVVPRQRKTILKKIEKAKARGDYNLDDSIVDLSNTANKESEQDIEKAMIKFEKTKGQSEANNNLKESKDVNMKEINLKDEKEESLLPKAEGLKKSSTRNTLSVYPNNASTSSISSSKSEGKNGKQKSQKSLRSDEISFSEQVPIKDDKLEVAYLFKYLQILTACFASFAHGKIIRF